MTAVVFAGMLVGAGIWWVWSGARPARAPLGVLLGRLGHSDPRRNPGDRGARGEVDLDARVGEWARRLGIVERIVGAMRSDLRVMHRSADQEAALLVTSAVLGVAWGPVVVFGARLVGVTLPVAIALWLALLGGIVGVVISIRSVRHGARERRRAFRHALSAFCDVAGMCLAAGRGVESALQTAARAGDGFAFEEIRAALSSAYVRGDTPWDGLMGLGTDLAIGDLTELGAALSLAGVEGAAVRETVRSKARTIRERLTAESEQTAATVTERMGIPATFLLLGFVVFLGFPAIAVMFQ